MYTCIMCCMHRPSLKHQRPQAEHQKHYDDISQWYKRGEDVKTGAAKKFRKGACENCGSMTHKRKDCLDVSIVDGYGWCYYGNIETT